MGKKHRQKLEESGIEGTHVSHREWFKRAKEMFHDIDDAKNQEIANRTRAKFMPRWMEECGVEDWHDIDYKNPQIHLEFILCDPAILKDLQNEGGRDRLFQMLTEEEKDVYLNKTDDKGAKYTDLEGESGFTKKNIIKAVTQYRKVKKM